MIGVPSIFKLTRIVAAFVRLLPTFALSCVRKAAKTIYGFRCDERLETKVEESTRRSDSSGIVLTFLF